MPRLVVITHEFDAFASRPAPGQPATGIYLLFDVLEALESMGYETSVSSGLDPPEGDVALMHVDCTRIPQPYLDLAERFALTLNAGTADISKRRVSRILVSPGDGWRGPVIVKSDINCGGEPELRLNAHARAAGKAEPFPGLAAPAPYAVLDGVDAVPEHVWRDETLVVERFLPELDPDGFVLRTWVFAGTRERCTRHVSSERIVKAAGMVSRSPAQVPDAIRAERERLGFDYGKFDFVIHDGQPILLDANRTPGASQTLRDYLKANAGNLATGLDEQIRARLASARPAHTPLTTTSFNEIEHCVDSGASSGDNQTGVRNVQTFAAGIADNPEFKMSDTSSQKLIIPALGGLYAGGTPLFEAVLRAVVGLWMVPHGAQKLFGMFGGGGISGTAGFFSQIGLEPAVLMAVLAGGTEFFGGILLAIGLLTRPAAVAICILLLVAIFSVHIGNGFFMQTGGFEYASLWFFAALYFVFRGGNRYSVDAKLGRAF